MITLQTVENKNFRLSRVAQIFDDFVDPQIGQLLLGLYIQLVLTLLPILVEILLVHLEMQPVRQTLYDIVLHLDGDQLNARPCVEQVAHAVDFGNELGFELFLVRAAAVIALLSRGRLRQQGDIYLRAHVG